jgi:hypothetical protein
MEARTLVAASYATATALDTVDNFLDTEIADIQARLPAALVGGRIDANVGAISGDATAADNLEAALDGTGGVTLTLGQLAFNPTGAGDCILMGGSGNGNGIGFTRSGSGEVFDSSVAAAIQAEAADALTAFGPATATNLATVDTVVDAIKVKTDSLTFTVSGVVDANIQRINDVTITGDGSAGDKFDVV